MNRVFCANLMDSIWLYVYRDFSHRLKRIANLRTIGILHRWIWIFINRLKETEGFLQYYDGDDDVIPGYNNNTPMMFKRDFLCKKCIGKRVHSWATKYDNSECTLHQNLVGWAWARWISGTRRDKRVWRLHWYCGVISFNPGGHSDEVMQQSKVTHSTICSWCVP